jgi:chromosome segregation ATPase
MKPVQLLLLSAVLLPAGLLTGCGGAVSLRVKPALVKALPVETRIDLLDAENAMFASIDAVDESKETLEQAEAELDASDDRIDEARAQKKKAQKGNDAAAADIAELAINEARERQKFLKVDLKVLEGDLHVKEAELDAARGRFELARAQAVKKVNLDGSQKLKLEEFQAQVDKLDARVAKVKESATALRGVADTQRQSWTESRNALSHATGGAQGSTWVE